AEPSTGLSDGDTLTVEVSGFPAENPSFSAGECVTPIEDFLQQCDVTNIVPVPLDADGSATFEITVKEGAIGSGTCGEGADQCVIAVGSLTEPEAGFAPIFFGDDEPAADDTADEPADEATDVAEELPATGPSDLVAMTVMGAAILAAGLILVGSTRRVRRETS
ncbi:MAG: neocarzinostatin apoprotein domain-containing protein, partial [Acidimicrobiia bacterium]|nr:neocarzinostatin apoprotein domain-containing protein [Acidimicrobiia bacterium]